MKDLTKEEKNNFIKTTKEISKTLENDPHNCNYARSDIIEKITKNCRGVKKCNNDANKTEKNKNHQY